MWRWKKQKRRVIVTCSLTRRVKVNKMFIKTRIKKTHLMPLFYSIFIQTFSLISESIHVLMRRTGDYCPNPIHAIILSFRGSREGLNSIMMFKSLVFFCLTSWQEILEEMVAILNFVRKTWRLKQLLRAIRASKQVEQVEGESKLNETSERQLEQNERKSKTNERASRARERKSERAR